MKNYSLVDICFKSFAWKEHESRALLSAIVRQNSLVLHENGGLPLSDNELLLLENPNMDWNKISIESGKDPKGIFQLP